MAIKPNYLDILAAKHSNLDVYSNGDPYIYENLVLNTPDATLPPQEELDLAAPELIKVLRWKEIQEMRDTRKAGGVKVGGNWFHSDDTSRIQFIALVMLGANMPPGIMWKTMQGTFITMTPSLASAIFQTIIGADNAVFGHAEMHRQGMNNSTDPLNYDITTGWPTIYGESEEAVVARAAGRGEGA